MSQTSGHRRLSDEAQNGEPSVAAGRPREDLALAHGYEAQARERANAGRRPPEREPEDQGSDAAGGGAAPAGPRPQPAPPSPETRALARRLQRLESQTRRATWLLLIMGLAVAYTAWAQLVPGQSTVQRTLTESSEVKLVDASGATRLFLRVASDSPVLQLIDRKGNTRLSLGMRLDETPFIDLSDKSGKTRATLEMSEHGEPSLKLYDENGKPSFAIN